MERATQDGYITKRSIHEKIIMHQTSWSYASSLTQTSWRWSYQHGKNYTRWLHHTPHQPSWSYASSITQPSWRWSYQHGKSYARWLHHTPTQHEKIIMHQPSWSYASSITQPSWRWSNKHGKNYTRWLHHTPIKTRKRISCINLHDHTHQAKPNHLGVGVINMERTTQDGYITHRSKHEKEYHASNSMIIRIKHNPTILALE